MTHAKKNHLSRPPVPSAPVPSGTDPAALGIPLPPAAVPLESAGPALDAAVHLAPAAAAKLGGEAPEKAADAASAARTLPGWQSLGKDHKPTHSNGKQGRREKKVRW